MTTIQVAPTVRTRTHSWRALAIAFAFAVVAGSSTILGLSAALDLQWTPKSAMLLALAAVWLPQTFVIASFQRRTRQRLTAIAQGLDRGHPER